MNSPADGALGPRVRELGQVTGDVVLLGIQASGYIILAIYTYIYIHYIYVWLHGYMVTWLHAYMLIWLYIYDYL